ncbi:hypothetical protein BASA81_011455 [Batrachochytrium salamandrivorans]|nr:hypothetical protein BASA81_011455 [Batrachochytrium salamandrivorans]
MNTAVDSNRQTQDINVKMSQRKHLAEVRYPAMFGALEKVIEEHSSGKWAVGDSISVADVSIYILVLMIKSALWDGIPTDLVDPFARVQAVFEAVRTHPKVLEWETAHPNMKGFAIATAASS